MKLLLPLVLALATTSLCAFAQERTAASPIDMASDVTNAAMLRKLSYQTQVINTLQAQLDACKTGEKYSGPTGIKDDSGYQPLKNITGSDESSTDSASSVTTRNHFQQGTAAATAPATAPSAPAAPRRAVGVYQQPSEPKLTCEDYSRYYFSRHPAMAAVCGVTVRQQPAEDSAPAHDEDIHVTPAETSSTRISPTTRLPQRP